VASIMTMLARRAFGSRGIAVVGSDTESEEHSTERRSSSEGSQPSVVERPSRPSSSSPTNTRRQAMRPADPDVFAEILQILPLLLEEYGRQSQSTSPSVSREPAIGHPGRLASPSDDNQGSSERHSRPHKSRKRKAVDDAQQDQTTPPAHGTRARARIARAMDIGSTTPGQPVEVEPRGGPRRPKGSKNRSQ
jgi:hypothetical protein